MASGGFDLSAFTNIPALPPPEGVTSNFMNPDSLAGEARAGIYLCLSFMVISVFLRIYTRIKVTRSWDVGDFSAISVIAWSALILTLIGDPLGPHQWNVPLSKITVRLLRNILISLSLYSLSSTLIKTTLLLYLLTFHRTKTSLLLIRTGILLILLFNLSTIIAFAIICTPRPNDGGLISPNSAVRCGQPSLKLSAAQGIFGSVTDLYVLLIPMKCIWDLGLSPSRKVGVVVVFLMGILALICSIFSAVYRVRELRNADFMWSATLVYLFAAAELNLGIICSCLPVIFEIFKIKGFSQTRIPSRRRKRTRLENKVALDQHSDEI